MTEQNQEVHYLDPEAEIQSGLKKATNAAMITGLIALILGIFAMIYPQSTGSMVAKLLGIILIVGGCIRFIFAIWSFSFGSMIWRYALALIMFLAGYWIYTHPDIGLEALTMLLAIYFLVDGINQIAYYRSIRHFGVGPFLLIDGIISVVIAILIFAKWPESSNYVLGIFIGLKLAMDGLSVLLTGWGAKKLLNS